MTHKNCVPAWDSYWHKWQVSTAISNLKNCLFTTSSVRCLTALLTATEGSNESEDQVSFSHFNSLTPFPVNDSQIQPMPTCYGISVANNFANLKSVILCISLNDQTGKAIRLPSIMTMAGAKVNVLPPEFLSIPGWKFQLTSWVSQQFFHLPVPEFMFYSFSSLVAAGCFGYSIERRNKF